MSKPDRPASHLPPFTLVICGRSASGKSTLAAWAASSFGLAVISSDLVRKELARIKPSDRAPAAHYSDPWNQRIYAELGRRAAASVRRGGGVIVDATFRSRQNREAFAGTFGGAAPVLFVECHAPLQVLLARAKAREKDPASVSDASPEVVARQYDQWEPLDEVPAGDRTAIDAVGTTTQVTAELAAAIQEFLIRLG